MQKLATLFFLFTLIVFTLPIVSNAETEAERKERLESELKQLDQKILKQQRLVEAKQQERQSLERDVNLLETQISKAQLGIKARAVAIEQLIGQIGEKETVLEILEERSVRQKQSISELIRKTAEVDEFSLVELMLSNKNFSEFFADFENFRTINSSLNDSIKVLAEIKIDTATQKEVLEEKQLTELELKQAQENEKAKIQAQEKEKENILAVTKGEEAAYQELLNQQKKSAAQIRAELFQLLGGGGQIPLPEAIQYAKAAENLTGTPASLILAILKQETDLGGNLGSCVMGDYSAGQEIMHPTRDMPVFLAIADALGFDAETQQVSCPLKRSDGSRIGWGGAMGPSQFIPSTWAIYGGIVNAGSGWTYNSSSDAIRRLRGGSAPANPFNNQDAFLATALLMRDNGANGTYAGDRLAALRYYAGWGGASKPQNAFYGDGVMNYKAQFEADIRTLASE